MYGKFVIGVYSCSLAMDLEWNTRVGGSGHVMTYIIGSGKTFNFVLVHPDDTDPSTWGQKDNISDMKNHFKGWDPVYVYSESYLYSPNANIHNL